MKYTRKCWKGCSKQVSYWQAAQKYQWFSGSQQWEQGYPHVKRDDNVVSHVTGCKLCIFRNVRNETSLITKTLWTNEWSHWQHCLKRSRVHITCIVPVRQQELQDLGRGGCKMPPEVNFEGRCPLRMPKPSSYWSHVSFWMLAFCTKRKN